MPKFRYFMPKVSFFSCWLWIRFVAYRQSKFLRAIAARMGQSSARVVSLLLPFQLGTMMVFTLSSFIRWASESSMTKRERSLPIL